MVEPADEMMWVKASSDDAYLGLSLYRDHGHGHGLGRGHLADDHPFYLYPCLYHVHVHAHAPAHDPDLDPYHVDHTLHVDLILTADRQAV